MHILVPKPRKSLSRQMGGGKQTSPPVKTGQAAVPYVWIGILSGGKKKGGGVYRHTVSPKLTGDNSYLVCTLYTELIQRQMGSFRAKNNCPYSQRECYSRSTYILTLQNGLDSERVTGSFVSLVQWRKGFITVYRRFVPEGVTLHGTSEETKRSTVCACVPLPLRLA